MAKATTEAKVLLTECPPSRPYLLADALQMLLH
jgi:hypothetical protein